MVQQNLLDTENSQLDRRSQLLLLNAEQSSSTSCGGWCLSDTATVDTHRCFVLSSSVAQALLGLNKQDQRKKPFLC